MKRPGLLQQRIWGLLVAAISLNCSSAESPAAGAANQGPGIAGAGGSNAGQGASASVSGGSGAAGSGAIADGGAMPVGGFGGLAGTGPVSSPGSKSWYPQDISFTSQANKANPYLDVTDFSVTFTGPQGEQLVVPGFYTGDQLWKVRFAPTVPGTFSYVTSSAQDPSLDGLSGNVAPAEPNPTGHGALKIDATNPHHYLYEDGSRPFQMGYELDWLGLMDFGDAEIPKAISIIDVLAAHGFSEVLMNAYAYDTSWKTGKTSDFDFGPPALIPWAGTNADPDYAKMNEAFWQSYDNVIAYLFEKGITAHVMVKVYNKQVNWPTRGSATEDLYFKFIVARYQAYSNVVWDFSKEAFYEKDHDYIASRLDLIKAHDGYQRLRTLHDPDGGQSQLSPNYYDEVAHAGTVDFYTDQSSGQYATAMGALTKRAMPYYNAEVTLYQVGNDGTFTYGRRESKEEVFAASMEVVMAGGYFAYYYSLHAWDVVKWSEVPEGLEWYKNVSDFIKTTAWYTLAASDDLIGGGGVGEHCLADPGREYIVYQSGSGGFNLDIAATAAPLAAKWVNLATNAQSSLPDQGNGSHEFTNPWPDPAVLHLVAD